MPHISKLKKYIIVFLITSLIHLFVGQLLLGREADTDSSEELMGGSIKISEGLMSIEAVDVRPEDLVKELGEKCNIKVVLYGEVFSETPVSVKFQQVPIRQGIERILKLAKIKNYLIHFEEHDTNSGKIVELDLIGKKGGERQLTSGFGRKSSSMTSEQVKTKIEENKMEKARAFKAKLNKEEAKKMQETFLDIMDQILEDSLEEGQEPDPQTIIKLFNDVVPPEMKENIPPEVLEELEKLGEK